MEPKQRSRLEAAGFRETTIQELLELSGADVAWIEMHVQLGRAIREERERREMSQRAFATMIGTSQSRLAKMEGGDTSCSLDRLIRALLAAGLDRRRVAEILAD